MSRCSLHLARAAHNIETAHYLEKADLVRYADWIVTMSFYACVHYAEAAFDGVPGVKGSECCPPNRSKHDFRQDMVERHFAAAALDYGTLRRVSERARYHANKTIRPNSVQECLRAAAQVKATLGF